MSEIESESHYVSNCIILSYFALFSIRYIVTLTLDLTHPKKSSNDDSLISETAQIGENLIIEIHNIILI